MIVLQDERGLVFWREDEVSSLMPDFGGRWRGVRADGSVAHRATAPPLGPWVRLGEGWVGPRHLRAGEQGWLDSAGFLVGSGPLEQGPLEELESPEVAGLGCTGRQVLGLRRLEGGWIWQTEVGDFPEGGSADQASGRHPELVEVSRDFWVNRRRLERIERKDAHFVLLFDTGAVAAQVRVAGHEEVAERFGLPHFHHLEPEQEALGQEQLRDYPYELALAHRDVLQRDFSEARVLIANLVWQAMRYRQAGQPRKQYGKSYRGFWYTPVKCTLFRAGFLDRITRLSEKQLWDLYLRLVAQFVGEDRLFTFADLGFVDSAPLMRRLGTQRPEVVVIAEKESQLETLDLFFEELGVSTIYTGGMPKLLATEYFARALREVVAGSFRPMALVDFDLAGWRIGSSFCDQMGRYDFEKERAVEYLVRPELFSAEELELFALPSLGDQQAWVALSGGIGGKALSIHANHLPPERALAALKAML